MIKIKCIEAIEEIYVPRGSIDDTECTPEQHTAYRSLIGQLNWVQSRTQFQIYINFSRCASALAKPKIKDLKEGNKVLKMLKSGVVKLRYKQLRGNLRIVGYPDASYRNNPDNTSQRGSAIFIAEGRTPGVTDAPGCLIDYESTKIKRAVLSTTVSELYALMKTLGNSLFLKGLWMNMAGDVLDIQTKSTK